MEHLPPMTVVIFTANEPARLSQREGKGPPPDLDGIGLPTLGDVGSMTASFRLAVQQLQRLLRAR